MTENVSQNGHPVRVCVVLGSKRSDKEAFDKSSFAEYMAKLGIGWCLSYCSAERHLPQLVGYLAEKWASGIRHFVAFVGWSPRLPAAIAAALPSTALVYGVAKLAPDLGVADPAPSIVVSTPGCPIITAGLDRAGLGNVALVIGMILAQTDPDMAEKVEHLRKQLNGEPEFDVPAGVTD